MTTHWLQQRDDKKWQLTDHPLRAPPHPDDIFRDWQVVWSAYPLHGIQETGNLYENDDTSSKLLTI